MMIILFRDLLSGPDKGKGKLAQVPSCPVLPLPPLPSPPHCPLVAVASVGYCLPTTSSLLVVVVVVVVVAVASGPING